MFRKYRESLSVKLRATVLASLAVALTLLCLSGLSAHAAEPAKSILLLYSYGHGSKGVGIFDDGMLDTLFANGVNLNNLYFEYLDLERNKDDSEHLAELKKSLERKYPKGKIDLIMTGQQPALKFLLANGTNIAPGAPVITFQAPPPTEEEAGARKFLCIVAKFDVAGTVRHALALFPKTEKVLVVVGDSEADRTMANIVDKAVAPWKERVKFEYTTGMALDEVLGKVGSTGKNTVILFTQFNKDAKGFVTVAYEVEGKVVRAANAPVFGLYDFNLRNGGVGGSVVSVHGLGVQMANLMTDLLAGRVVPAGKVTPVESKVIPLFDYVQIERWGGDAGNLPADAVFLNREPGLWESYRWYIVGMAALFALETALILLLLEMRRRKLAAERRLSENELRFGNIIATAMDGFWVADLRGRFILVNDAYCRMSGYSREKLLTMSIADVEATETPADVGDRIEEIRVKGRAHFESRHRASDGRIFDVEVSVQYQPWDEGNCIAFIRDITERKEAEARLRESEAKFSSAFQNAPLMFAITELDTGRYIEVNQEVLRISGFTREEMIGKTAIELGWNSPENRARMKEELASRGRITGQEMTLTARDGRKVACLVSGESIVVNGRACLLTATTDITARKIAEEGLRRYQLLAEHSRDIILFIDRESGRLLEANAAAADAYGYSREELLGLTIFDLRAPDAVGLTASQIADAASRGIMFETLHRRKDGKVFPVEVSSQGRLVNGAPMLISVVRDITERKTAETERLHLQERLAQAQKMEAIGTLAGGIAHDFNNILGAIMGFTELSLAQLPEDSDVKENLEDVLAASFRAKELVQQILAFGRRGSKRVLPVEVDRVVAEAMKLLVSVIPKTIAIKQEFENSGGLVMANPTEIHQVVVNLCTNAYQSMAAQSSGVLRVALARVEIGQDEAASLPTLKPGGYLKLEVEDTGPGIDETVQKRIFEPYFTTKEQGKGTGLGLATVHGIVTSLGGATGVKSTVGAGSVFTVYLPLAPAEAVEPEMLEASAVTRGTEKILLVDDEPGLARMGRKMLENLGYTVTEATDPALALSLFESDPEGFDVIVTDQTMPGLTGVELARRAKAKRPGIPVVMCTGYSELINEENAGKLGIQEYLRKPYDIKGLGRAVASALKK